jgi:hypothetical protein
LISLTGPTSEGKEELEEAVSREGKEERRKEKGNM